jgi:hypothetical protein
LHTADLVKKSLFYPFLHHSVKQGRLKTAQPSHNGSRKEIAKNEFTQEGTLPLDPFMAAVEEFPAINFPVIPRVARVGLPATGGPVTLGPLSGHLAGES